VPKTAQGKKPLQKAAKKPIERFFRAKKASLDFGMPFGLTETRKDQ